MTRVHLLSLHLDLVVARVALQVSRALNSCLVDKVTVSYECKQFLSYCGIDKVTVSYECEQFLRKAWHIWHDGLSPFFYDVCKVSERATLHLPLELGACMVDAWAFSPYV